MKTFLLISIFSVISLFGVCRAFSQPFDKPDLRDGSCVICRGNASNYSILNVYFSDAAGNPINVCEGTGPYFISLLYTSNAKTDINNFRLFADIIKRNRTTNSQIGESTYINEFSGTVSPCNDATCIVTLPIPDLGFECTNEYYELSRPLVSWTNSKVKDLEESYTCNDYPAAQCLNAPNIPIEVGLLEYNFEPRYECFENNFDETDVTFVITSLFGGNPTLEYDIEWEFLLPNGATFKSNEVSQIIVGVEAGEKIEAKLTINQGSLNGTTIERSFTVPPSLTLDQIIIEDETIAQDTEEGESNGFIDITFKEGDYFYFWTSVDDPNFYSEETRIEDLPIGTYILTTYDLVTGLCRTDRFEIGAKILPVEFLDPSVRYESSSKLSYISWATAKENANSHFEIERSDKGINDFKKVGEIDGMGWKDTVTEYEFIDDKLPLSGGNILYRIKQVDFDGNSTYSKVISVRAEGVQATEGVWRAYPNPTMGDLLRISLLDRTQYDEEQITFRIVHPNLITQGITVNTEDEMNDQLAQLIPRAPKGVLVVEIQWGQKVEHIKVLKK